MSEKNFLRAALLAVLSCGVAIAVSTTIALCTWILTPKPPRKEYKPWCVQLCEPNQVFYGDRERCVCYIPDMDVNALKEAGVKFDD